MHALQTGISSGAQAGDRDLPRLPIVPANFLKLLHSYLIIFCSVRKGVVAYERRIGVRLLFAKSFLRLLLSIALGLGSKNLANIFLVELTSTTFHFPTYIRRAHACYWRSSSSSSTTTRDTLHTARDLCLGARLPTIMWTGRCSAAIRRGLHRYNAMMSLSCRFRQQITDMCFFFLTVYPFELSWPMSGID